MILRRQSVSPATEVKLAIGVREAYRSPRHAFERPMYGARVVYKVLSGPREADEKLMRQQIALESIARSARGHDVLRIVGAAVSPWHHMIKRGVVRIER
jgi:hypothetical protein